MLSIMRESVIVKLGAGKTKTGGIEIDKSNLILAVSLLLAKQLKGADALFIWPLGGCCCTHSPAVSSPCSGFMIDNPDRSI
jgi:hypothetical protein